MKVSWSIRRRLPTANDWHGGPRWKYLTIARAWKREFPPTARKPEGCRIVRITRLYGPRKRAYDPDNLVAGCKPILDALVACGWLLSDRPEDCRIEVEQARAGACSTTVEIEDLG